MTSGRLHQGNLGVYQWVVGANTKRTQHNHTVRWEVDKQIGVSEGKQLLGGMSGGGIYILARVVVDGVGPAPSSFFSRTGCIVRWHRLRDDNPKVAGSFENRKNHFVK